MESGVPNVINRGAGVNAGSTVPTNLLIGPCVRARVRMTFLVSVSVIKVCLLLKEVNSEVFKNVQ